MIIGRKVLVASGVLLSILTSAAVSGTPADDEREQCKKAHPPDTDPAAYFHCVANVSDHGPVIPHPAAMEDPDKLKAAKDKADKEKREEENRTEKPKHYEPDKPIANN